MTPMAKGRRGILKISNVGGQRRRLFQKNDPDTLASFRYESEDSFHQFRLEEKTDPAIPKRSNSVFKTISLYQTPPQDLPMALPVINLSDVPKDSEIYSPQVTERQGYEPDDGSLTPRTDDLSQSIQGLAMAEQVPVPDMTFLQGTFPDQLVRNKQLVQIHLTSLRNMMPRTIPD